MDDWVTTKEASLIKKVGLTQHRIAELARQGEVVARKAGKKKWCVKVILNNGKYELVKPMALGETEQVSLPVGQAKELTDEQQAEGRENLIAQQLIQQWREQAEFLSIDQFLRKLYLETRHTDLAYEDTEPEEVRQAYFRTFGRYWETMLRPYKAMLPVESDSLFEHLKRLHPDAEVWQAQESWSEAYGIYWDAFGSWIVEVEYDSELLMGAAVDESTSAGPDSKVANVQRLIKEIKRIKPDVWLFLRLLALTVACDLLLFAMGEQPATWALEAVKIRKLRQDVVFVSMKELPKHFWLIGTNRVYPVAKSLWDRYQLVKEKTTTLLKALERLQTAQSNLHKKLKILEHSLL